MQATHGFAFSRTRVIGYAIAFALALSALVLALASTARAAEPPHKSYLASGTSVTFGYSQELFNELFPTENPAAFEEALGSGYDTEGGRGVPHQPNGVALDYFHILQASQESSSTWTRMINDGCPGETSGSYIGNGTLGAILSAAIPGTQVEAPCGYHNVNGFELHHPYKGGKRFQPEVGESQLENVVETIKRENTGTNATHHPIQIMTMDLGANDLLRAVKKCEKEVAEGIWTGASGEPPLTECEIVNLPATIEALATNVSAVLFAIRNGAAICVAECGPEDHGVNFRGPILFGGFYNPFGAVFTPGVELNPGSNFLDFVINKVMKRTVEKFGVCYANPQSSPSNPAHAFNQALAGNPLAEPEKLQQWTNMANPTSAVNGTKGANGPDIHPTPAGYQVLAEGYAAECH
jgi:hypothetical protein